MVEENLGNLNNAEYVNKAVSCQGGVRWDVRPYQREVLFQMKDNASKRLSLVANVQ